jgi:hypothetical protein
VKLGVFISSSSASAVGVHRRLDPANPECNTQNATLIGEASGIFGQNSADQNQPADSKIGGR